jgi:hypothetical protein
MWKDVSPTQRAREIEIEGIATKRTGGTGGKTSMGLI